MSRADTPSDPQQTSLLDLFERPPIEALYSPDQIFESDDPGLLIRLTEDARFDRKSAAAQGKELAKYLSAFGDGPPVEGGVLAIGIEKDGIISGCLHLGQDRLSEIESCGSANCADGRASSRRLSAKNSKGHDDFIVLVRVHYVESKLVCLTNGEAYERVGDQCKKLSEEKKRNKDRQRREIVRTRTVRLDVSRGLQ